eukprot:TRINITY_DN21920_c0_g1_i1.p1 TRINITY_DN21920_c0_g1~~TRINITY_DN21920_c0_g1_i1.p1  ORF type:complete len:324 (+),score=42.37 TRINITY_DN21920_c0_g1_i1:108-974(+)
MASSDDSSTHSSLLQVGDTVLLHSVTGSDRCFNGLQGIIHRRRTTSNKIVVFLITPHGQRIEKDFFAKNLAPVKAKQPRESASKQEEGVRPEVARIWEKMLEHGKSKDVKLVCADGAEVWAHGSILSVASDVFQSMLASKMVEGQSQEIDVGSYSAKQLEFILGLLYTGQVDDDEDGGTDKATNAKTRLELVLAATSFFKKYMIGSFLTWMVACLKDSLDVGNFQEILRFAISEDIAPVRWSCVKYAEQTSEIKSNYERKVYAPEVQWELQALWPEPVQEKSKKRKTF